MRRESIMHIIRLRSAWESTLQLHTRRFGRPTNLDPGERVLLVFDGFVGSGAVSLNGQPLGEISSTGRHEFNVTTRLEFRNVVQVAADHEITLGDVRLEIG